MQTTKRMRMEEYSPVKQQSWRCEGQVYANLVTANIRRRQTKGADE